VGSGENPPAEAEGLPMSDVWIQWEGHVVNGTLPLLRCLGASDHSGVFLTEYAVAGLPKAALKLVPAIPSLIEAQLSHWRAAIGLSHPRLLRLYEGGRCQLGERHFLFLVMEHAEQNLAEVLPHRALTADEAREMLLPTLDALSFLHRQNLVQGQLKPANILVVGDQLKLASDSIRPASEATANIATPSVYDAPEMEREIFTTAADVWALGATLVEALTQHPPTWSDQRRSQVMLSQQFPAVLADTVRRCLSLDPAARPDVPTLSAWIEGRSPANAAGAARPSAASESPSVSRAAPAHRPAPVERPSAAVEARVPERRPLVPLVVGIVALMVAGWAALHVFSIHHTPAAQPINTAAAPPASAEPSDRASAGTQSAATGEAANETREPPTPAPVAAPPDERSNTPAPANEATRTPASTVLHEEIPQVPKSARDTIHGHVRVTVRVSVDSSGAVVGEQLDDPGPSRYFARLATQAARKWKFSSSDDRAPRAWVVRFEFSRDGTTGHAVRSRS
jgi:outer membrane biosynthesis protein TonB